MAFDWTTFALEILNFLVLVWLLQRLFYRPVLAALDARQARVQAELDQASQAQRDAEALRQQYEDRMADWRRQADARHAALEQALARQRAAAEAQLRQTQADAEDKARARRSAAEAARETELRRQARQAALAEAAAMLKRLACPALDARIVQVLEDDLAALPAAQAAALAASARRLGDGARAELVSAHPLDDAQRDRIAMALAAVTGRPLAVDMRTDPELIAGVRIGIGDSVLHANLADEFGFFAREDAHA